MAKEDIVILKQRGDEEIVADIYKEWEEGEDLFGNLNSRLTTNRDFYQGINQWNTDPEGELKLTINVTGAIVDLYVALLANNLFDIKVVPRSSSAVDKVVAEVSEKLVYKALRNAKFKKRFKKAVKNQILFGFTWLFDPWNAEKTLGSPKGSVDIRVPNPWNIRVRYKTNEYDEVESFVTHKRMLPGVARKAYQLSFDPVPDSNKGVHLPQTIQKINDGMCSVFNRWDDETYRIVINSKMVYSEDHKYGFVPLLQVDGIDIPNDPVGQSIIERFKDLQRELNRLVSALSEIAMDKAYPPLIEYNNALGGKKVPKWRGQKIPARRSDQGESLAYLNNPAEIQGLINQVQFILEMIHFVALMPKAAVGVFDAQIRSGFQAKLAMQPATHFTESLKVEWEDAAQTLVQHILKLIRTKDPSAVKVKLPDGNEIDLGEIENHEVEVIWPENLPIDEARLIQNVILKLQNNLTSLYKSMEELGDPTPTDTLDEMRQESEMVEVQPQKVLQIQQAKQAIASFQMAIKQLSAQTQQPMQTPPEKEVNQNATNRLRSATSPLPEERKPVPETAREAVVPESTGGMVIPPEQQGGG